MTVLTSGVVMAGYVCPLEAAPPAMVKAMSDMPCSEMDMEQPVQCAEYQSGADLALEYVAAAPILPPAVVSYVMPASLPIVPKRLIFFIPAQIRVDATDPPYLRTLRLRI